MSGLVLRVMAVDVCVCLWLCAYTVVCGACSLAGGSMPVGKEGPMIHSGAIIGAGRSPDPVSPTFDRDHSGIAGPGTGV